MLRLKTQLLSLSLIMMTLVAHSQSTLKILPLGNSITYDKRDYDSRPTGDKTGYRYMLYTLLTANGYNFDFIGSFRSGYNYFDDCDNSGFPGIDSDNLADIIQTGTSAFTGKIVNGPYLNYFPADVILLEIGTNDVYGGSYSVTEVNRLLNAVDTYETNSGKPVLVIVATIISFQYYACTAHPGVTQFNNNLRSLIESRINGGDKLLLAEMVCDAGLNYNTDMYEELHPNPTGYDKMGSYWYSIIESINERPVVSDIPNQAIAEGNSFTQINLDSYVTDPDNTDSEITWTTVPSSPTNFTVTINSSRMATITPKNADWNGSETITFVASDPGKYVPNLHRSAQNNAVFTVTAVNDPPVIQSQTTNVSVNEDANTELLIGYFNVTDVDSPIGNLSLIVQAGTNYTFSGNRIYPVSNFNGALSVNVKVSDGLAQSSTFQALVTVNPVNDPPVLTLPANRLVNEREAYLGQLFITDIDAGDNLTIVPVTKPSWLNYNQTNKTLYGTPSQSDVGSHQVTMRGSDTKVLIDSTFTITVINTDNPPVITSVPVTAADDYELYTYTLTATDQESSPVTYSALMVPSWTQFNASTGLLSGTPRYYDIGDFQVKLRASDGSEYTDQEFFITVHNTNDTPVIVSQPDTIAEVDSQFTYTMVVEDRDEDDVIVYSALALPAWLTFYPGSDLLAGKPTSAEIGEYTIVLQASDGKAVVNQQFKLIVDYASAVPEFTASDHDLVIYPNPARDEITLSCTGGFIQAVGLYDLTGKPLFSAVSGSGSKELHIDHLNLPCGIYIVKVITNSGTAIGKINIR